MALRSGGVRCIYRSAELLNRLRNAFRSWMEKKWKLSPFQMSGMKWELVCSVLYSHTPTLLGYAPLHQQLVCFKPESTRTHTAIKKTTQASYPIILLMLSARGRAFSLFDYLRYRCYEICSQFMKVRWDCSMAAFASYDCHRNFTVFQNKRAHSQTRNIVSLQKKKRTHLSQQSIHSDYSKMQPSPKIKCIGGT